jgi:hypothetical protein
VAAAAKASAIVMLMVGASTLGDIGLNSAEESREVLNVLSVLSHLEVC